MSTGPLPMVSSPAEARELVERVTSDAGMTSLVEIFASDDGGLLGLTEYLRGLRSELPVDEQDQVDRILSSWERAQRQSVPTLPQGARPRLDWLRSFAADRWDFRQGRERDRIPVSHELFPDQVAQSVYGLADEWGMRAPNEAIGEFDAVLVLGGLIRANLNRPQSAADMLAGGEVSTPVVVGLCGDRAMSAEELELARSVGVPADSEPAALAHGLSRSFGLDVDDLLPTLDSSESQVVETHTASGLRVMLATAPRDRGSGARATTGDAFSWFITQSGLVRPNSRLLVVTTPIYWIQNHINVLEKLQVVGGEAAVVTVGGTAEVMPGQYRQPFRSQHYLQEFKSVIDALPSLLDWADATEVDATEADATEADATEADATQRLDG